LFDVGEDEDEDSDFEMSSIARSRSRSLALPEDVPRLSYRYVRRVSVDHPRTQMSEAHSSSSPKIGPSLFLSQIYMEEELQCKHRELLDTVFPSTITISSNWCEVM